uniref:Uncharacterized protein n=1 Tax=Bicosoecida sp. CB-2014 TaxID=1486930 RepID=A0A7S1CAC7_9STRA
MASADDNPFADENPFETRPAGRTAAAPAPAPYTPPVVPGGDDVDVFAAVGAATGAPAPPPAPAPAASTADASVFSSATPPAQAENPFAPAGARSTPGAFPTLSAEEAARRNPDAAAAMQAQVELPDDSDSFKDKVKGAIRRAASRAAANKKSYGTVVFLVAGSSLALFVFSLTFLSNQTRSGSGCSSDNCDTTDPTALRNCAQLVVEMPDGSVTCDDVCSNSVFLKYRPFQFRFVGDAYAAAGVEALWCTFPTSGNNWRIVTTFFGAAFLGFVTLFQGLYRSQPKFITATMFGSFVFACILFFIMCSDSDSVRSGASQCGDNFHDAVQEQFWPYFSNIECEMASYTLVCLLDAGMFVLWAALTYITHPHRRINAGI